MTYKQVSKTDVFEAINRVANTDDGQILLAWLCHDCGFHKNMMSMECPNKTQVYAAKRGVYASLRKSIRPEHLLQAEYKIQIVEDKIEKAEPKT